MWSGLHMTIHFGLEFADSAGGDPGRRGRLETVPPHQEEGQACSAPGCQLPAY